MADSTSNIDQIQTSQASKEVTANSDNDAGSPAYIFGRRASTSAALTWGYYGGKFNIAGTPTTIANGTVALTASTTNYIRVANATGVVDKVTSPPSGWPGPVTGYTALYEVVTGSATATSWTDWRQGIGTAGATGATGAAGATWSVSVNAQTGTTYTLVSGDNGKVVTLSNGSAITLTVPSGLGANFACELIQIGAGQVTVAASGVTLNSYTSLVKLAGQHAAATLIAYVSDVFNLSGNLST